MWSAVTFGAMLKRSWKWKGAAVVWVAGYALLCGLIAWFVASDLMSWQWRGRTFLAMPRWWQVRFYCR